MSPYVRLLRPKQWTKNGFVFAGLVFSGAFVRSELVWKTAAAFVLFCMASSAVYVVNDILDREEDRRHPLKKRRPIASGEAAVPVAWALGITLAALALTGAFVLSPAFGAIVAGYFAVNVIYSRFLKHVVILDVLIVAFGFVARAASGGVVIDVAISPWLLICTTLLALFIAISKRRHELILLGGEAHAHRIVLAHYSERMLDQMISVVTSSTVMAYSLYTFQGHQEEAGHPRPGISMMWTIPFVLYGIFRYLYIVYSKNEAGSPEEVLLKDRPLLVNLVLWAGACGTIMYLHRS